MGVVEVKRYLDRAEDFLSGMKLLRLDPIYRNSSALLAIHSAISYTDALRTGLGDENVASEDHQTASNSLRLLLKDKAFGGDKGLRHLESLLSRKSLVAYSSRRMDANDLEEIFLQAERYATWANSMGRTLRVEGWRDGGE